MPTTADKVLLKHLKKFIAYSLANVKQLVEPKYATPTPSPHPSCFSHTQVIATKPKGTPVIPAKV
jgi:hypothetical protein